MAGHNIRVHLDARHFNNTMREDVENFRHEVGSKTFKESIVASIAQYSVEETGFDTGASKASVDALHEGDTHFEGDYTNQKGITRHAYEDLNSEGFTLDPIDEKGRSYGDKSIAVDVSKFSDLAIKDKKFRKDILDALERSFT